VGFAVFLQMAGGLTRLEGLVLLVLLGLSLGWIVRSARRGNETDISREVAEFVDREHPHPLKVEIPRTLLGMAGTLAGAQLLVYGAVEIADIVGVAEGFVWLTLVAVGTSLPELVTAIQSARRSETDLIIGNLLGSNIFNSLAVGGLAAVVGPGDVDPTLSGQAAAVMVAVALLAWLFMHTGRRVTRWEAVLLLAGFPAAVVLVGV
jgi:cation:H+ antiporter